MGFVEIKMKKKAIIISIKGSKLTKKEKILLSKEKPWGLILFKRNIKSLKQLKKLIKQIRDITRDKYFPIMIDEEGSAVEAEVALVNIDLNDSNKKKIYEVCDFYRARKIENENNSIIFEIAGASERINRFIKEVNQITKIEIVRSGPVAISTYKNTKED